MRISLPISRANPAWLSDRPRTDYRCNTCGNAFELPVRSSTVPACPQCGSTALARQVSLTAPQGSQAIITAGRRAAAREGHFSHYSAAERPRSGSAPRDRWRSPGAATSPAGNASRTSLIDIKAVAARSLTLSGFDLHLMTMLPSSVPHPRSELSPIPHRKLIRSWLTPISAPHTAWALSLVVLDIVLFAAATAATVLLNHAALQLVAGTVTGFVIGRLFILGHDACHQSLTRHRNLNRWLGRLVFLPSLTPYSLWEVGHNVVHHGYTNLKGFDFVWQPRSMEEFQALPRWKRTLERVYRSGWAPWLYYLVEIWWTRMMLPAKRHMPTRRAVFIWDGLLICAGALVWIGGLVAAAAATGQSAWWLVTVGFALPFIVWNGMIGFVVYVHHTHLGVAWYEDKKAWAAAHPFVSTTVHLTFRSAMGGALHHIMEHTAHHVDMSVPLYRLKQAQRLLESKLPGRIVIQPFSWRWYVGTARRCKLYDFKARCWTDFAGRPTSTPVPACGRPS